MSENEQPADDLDVEPETLVDLDVDETDDVKGGTYADSENKCYLPV